MVIGITGQKRSGKDTVGTILVEDYGFIKTPPFAVFKTALGQWFDLSPEQMDGDLKEEVDPRWGFSPRRLFQIFGSELMKDDLSNHIPLFGMTVGQDVWAKVWGNWYGKQDMSKNYVVCDVRFPEEVDVIKSFANAHVVKVVNEQYPVKNADSHSSERLVDLLSYDHLVYNPMNMDGLKKAVAFMLEEGL